MGMAASQARFLGLTARLNNVEFEAQQINQQRTALSNKSASYYSDLLGMSVPTAPSVDAYTQTIYTFDDGALTNQITSMVATGNGRYKVSYLKTWEDDNAIVSATPRIISTDGSNYFIGSQLLRQLDQWYINPQNMLTFENGNGDSLILRAGKFYYAATPNIQYTGTDVSILDQEGMFAEGYYKDLTLEQIRKLSEMEAQYLNLVQQETGSSGGVYTRYIQNTTTNEWEPVFMLEQEVLPPPAGSANYDTNGNSINNINAYQFGSKTRVEEVIGVDYCEFEQDSTGRYINITIPNNGSPITYALTTNTITDQDAYNDALNQYEYDKALYDQSIAEINAKIEIVQAEDKDLELRLKQLDTEHNAIQTERDQVKELIKKNVDSSFKTFG